MTNTEIDLYEIAVGSRLKYNVPSSKISQKPGSFKITWKDLYLNVDDWKNICFVILRFIRAEIHREYCILTASMLSSRIAMVREVQIWSSCEIFKKYWIHRIRRPASQKINSEATGRGPGHRPGRPGVPTGGRTGPGFF